MRVCYENLLLQSSEGFKADISFVFQRIVKKTVDTAGAWCYNENTKLKSKSLFVKCRSDGELPIGRKTKKFAVWALHPASYGKNT